MTTEFETILVTTDLSETGNQAVPRAFRLAEHEGARLVLLHVLEGGIPNPLYAHYYPSPSPEGLRQQEAEGLRVLEELIPERARGVKHSIRLSHGSPAAEICRIAEEEGASLIVIASHGRTALKRFLIGSVAERVVRHAPCSVMLLRGDA